MRTAIIVGVMACFSMSVACTSVGVPVPSESPDDSPVVDSIVDESSSPGSGSSPSEESVDGAVEVYDLSGYWEDNSRVIRITQDGTQIVALYMEPYICDHSSGAVSPGEIPDGTGETSETDLDFRATITGNKLIGETHVCNWETGGAVHEFGAGLMLTAIELTINADATELTGTWYNPHDEIDEPLTITRLDPPV
ncbi:MAG: hypothetical protein KAV00_04130 [Phycisphaerae bacterium]|nr:hypothetical protein [Phycisphaerae bacterium]